MLWLIIKVIASVLLCFLLLPFLIPLVKEILFNPEGFEPVARIAAFLLSLCAWAYFFGLLYLIWGVQY